jgi:hypothetical protein
LGPQHAGGLHQLLEYAVRNEPIEALLDLSMLPHMLLHPGSVWSEAAVAGASANNSSSDDNEHLQSISFVLISTLIRVTECSSLGFAEASAA